MRGTRLYILFLMISSVVCFIPTIPTSIDALVDGGDILPESESLEEMGIDQELVTAKTREMLYSQFYENLGQVQNEVILYYGRFPGGMIGFGVSEVFIWLENTTSSIVQRFLGSEEVIPTAQSYASYKSNYFLGDRGTYVGVRSTSIIVYPDLYPGIDLEYSATSESVKYQFVVHPGADYRDIQVQCEGYDLFDILDTELRFEKEEQGFIDNGLVSYQGERSIETKFNRLDDSVYGFDVSNYDETQPLIIDPLLYSTIVSGSVDDVGRGITIDNDGFVYVTGRTLSPNFPVRFGMQTTYSGGSDAFLLKYHLESNELIFCTFLGGSGSDTASDIAVDGAGNIHIVGDTTSLDFPLESADDSTLDGAVDGFFLKMNPDGNTLLYSSYLGGSGSDTCLSLALNVSGFVHLTGWTNSTDLPMVSPVQGSHGGGLDMLVAIVDPLGNVDYSSYYGGTGDDIGTAIEFDSSRNVIVTGTVETGWPTQNAMNATCNGISDFGIVKLNPSCNQVLWGTYLGGSGEDTATGLVIDSNDDICLSGYSNSTDFPTANSLNATNNGGYDVVFSKLKGDGSCLNFSSYLGGPSDDYAYGIAVDMFDYLYIFGETFSSTFPILNAFNDTMQGTQDSFLCKLNSTGSNLISSTFFGGSESEKPNAIALDSVGSVYLTGWTTSTNFPLKFFAAQPSWLPDWTYRKAHTIFGGNGSGTDYQLQLQIYYDSGIDSGNTVYLSSNCQPDFDDLRFTDNDGITLLSYWIEDYTYGGSATVWVKVNDNLDTDQTIYLYYGNPLANSTSNGDATFIFFEDFEGTSLNTTKWSVTTYASGNTFEVINSELHADIVGLSSYAWSGYIFDTNEVFYDTNFQVHVESRWSGYDYSRGRAHVSTPFLIDNDTQVTGMDVSAYGDYMVTLYTYFDSSSQWSSVSDYTSGNAVFDYRVSGGSGFNMQMSGTYSRLFSGTIAGFSYPFNLGLYAQLYFWTSNMYADVYYDIVYIQKYSPTSPTHGIWEEEEVYVGITGGQDCFSIGFSNPDDADSDGITNSDELRYGTNWLSNDSDSDLMLDWWEIYFGLNASDPSDAALDLDGDGWSNLDEYLHNTLPNNIDSDFDLQPDYWEFNNSLNPLLPDAYGDLDLDGIINLYEFGNGTAANNNDTDFDLMPDLWEIENSLDPTVWNADGDPDLDALTNLLEYLNFGDPQDNDTDSDLIPDGWEYYSGLDLTFNDASADYELDGLNNLQEYQWNTDPYNEDSDFDTLLDGFEVFSYGTSPTNNDTEFDLMPDGWEVYWGFNPLIDDSANDSDLDGLSNLGEYIWGCYPDNVDSDSDSLTDGDEVNLYGTDPMDPLSPYTSPDPIYSTYFGSSSWDVGTSSYMDSLGYIYVTGYTSSSSFPISSAYDTTYAGGYDAFVFKLSPDGQTLVFSTFIGGTSTEYAYGLIVDSNFDVYITGITSSTDFPVFNAYDDSIASGTDGFILKLNSTGTGLVFSTYIGGTGDDGMYDIQIDGDNNIYAAGYTAATDWPTVNPCQSTIGGGIDTVIVKMRKDGELLMFSTYLGGSENDLPNDLTIDGKNRIVVIGRTDSTDFPVVNAIDSSYGGNQDAFLTRINSTDGSIDFSTFFGDTAYDNGQGCETDSAGNIYILGYTFSASFPVANAFDSTFNGDDDLFISKIAENGTSVYFSTFIGGTNEDYVLSRCIDLDQFNNIYVVAETKSTDIPTVDPFDDTHNGGLDDIYLLKMSADGQQLYYATYIGGSDEETPQGIFVSGSGKVTLSGSTRSSNFPLVSQYIGYSGSNEIFVMQFNNISDFDGDGICDSDEFTLDTNKLLPDTDFDLMPDGWEVLNGLNPILNDSALDLDADTLTNLQEYQLGTFANNNDSDFDLISDNDEITLYSSDPTLYDSDFDLICDSTEILTYGTLPNNNDTDSDFMADGWEVLHGLNPLVNDAGGDLDSDGVTNLEEFLRWMNPDSWDSDNDIIGDWDELYVYFSDPLNRHSPEPDRTPAFSSYFGGGGAEDLIGVTVGSDGFIYATGRSTSSDFPVLNAYDSSFNGNDDVVVLKIDPENFTLVYSTFIGGSSDDYGYTIATFNDGRAVVSGVTYSSNFPLINAHDSTLSGSYDAILLELNSTGNGLIFSTLIGGSNLDAGRGVSIINDETIVVAGWTSSTDLATINAYQDAYGGGNYDFLLFKALPDGTITYLSYLGGSGEDVGEDIDVDSSENMFVTGRTASSNFPMVNAYDDTFNGEYDCVLAKLASNGTTILWSTYMGGSYDDRGRGVAIDSHDNVVIAGYSESSNFPVVNAIYPTKRNYYDTIAFEFTGDGSTLTYSTFIGSNNYDYGYWIDIDAFDNVYLTGRVDGTDFPVLNAYDETHNSNQDVFVTKLNDTGSLRYSTYYGGSSHEFGYGIAVNELGRAIVVGRTSSSNLPVYNELDGSLNSQDGFMFILPNLDDFDSDGISDSDEAYYNCSWVKRDTDMDSMWDGWEVINGMNPSLNDSALDPDLDGLTNAEEFLYGCDPNFNDTDLDLLLDGSEVHLYNCNPTLVDTDLDTIPDGLEVLVYGTLPNSIDSDIDEMRDDWEILYGLDPLNATDALLDLDGEGILNLYEFRNGTIPDEVDSDFDLLDDFQEIVIYGTNPTRADTDSDSFGDGTEILVLGTDPLDPSDPVVFREPIYSSYLGGSSDDCGYNIQLDRVGNIVVSGYTYSSNFPLVNPYDSSVSSMDIFVTKFTSDGQTLLFSTYIGGSSYDVAYGMELDASDNIYLTGYTRSSNLPVTGDAFQGNFGGGQDSYIIKLSSAGNTLLFSSYLGGSAYEEGSSLRLGPDGDVWICGRTQSSNFPVTANAWDMSYGGNYDGFVSRINIPTHQIILSTFIGGYDYEMVYDIGFLSDGYLLLAGVTASPDFPVLNGYDESHNGGYDAFLIKTDVEFDNIIYSSYYGGSSDDYFTRIAENYEGDVVLSGLSISSNFPVMNGYDLTYNGGYDALLTRVNATTGDIEVATYIGGSSHDRCYSHAIDFMGNVYVTIESASSNFPMEQAFSETNGGGYDTVLLKMNKDLDTLIFSSYIGGSSDDCARDMVIDSNSSMYVTGYTYSSNFWVTNAYDSTLSGGHDAYLTILPPIGDSDSDGIGDLDESFYNTHPFNYDSDSDLIPDGWEILYGLNPLVNDSYLDPDNDSLSNLGEFQHLTNPLSNDSDSDLMPDGYEIQYGLSPRMDDSQLDLDSDGLVNILEYTIGTYPDDPDSDLDTMPDGYEYDHGLDPTTDDSTGDLDSDTLSNILEYTIGTLPDYDDSDSDLMPDGWEYDHGLNPLANDANADLESDGLTNLEEYNLGSNPASSDSDSDLMPDLWEYDNGLNLTVDDAAGDADSDGLSNLDEYLNGCDPQSGDSDSDDLGDLEEIETYGTSPILADTDRDLIPDGVEVLTLGTNPLLVDSDNDSLSDGFEYIQFGTDPTLYDTDFDGMSDYEEYIAGTNPLVADANDDSDGDGVSNIDEWEQGTDLFDSDSDHDGISDLDDPNPLHFDYSVPMSEYLIVGALVAGSIIPALIVVLSNERMFLQARGSRRKKKEEESDIDTEAD